MLVPASRWCRHRVRPRVRDARCHAGPVWSLELLLGVWEPALSLAGTPRKRLHPLSSPGLWERVPEDEWPTQQKLTLSQLWSQSSRVKAFPEPPSCCPFTWLPFSGQTPLGSLRVFLSPLWGHQRRIARALPNGLLAITSVKAFL